jgi:hypothetical protein
MHSSEDVTEKFSYMFNDWDIKPIQVDLNDNIVTVKLPHLDDAYDIMCDYEEPKYHSLSIENDNGDIWYKFRYQK